uniref:Uncharacterized protein n=1 Tax=Timema douglasi TaxID=61478 RepID=A0A7R8VXW3_TIMDO|nr:unnamed protein product [Timema douglasi]
MYQLQKLLTKKRIQLSICERNSFDGMSNSYLLNILLVTLYNEERNSSLKPVVPTLQPGMTWLLIFEETPPSSLVDTLVTTSLDVLILLAEHRTGSFFLTEVYRSASTHSVRRQHYGVWSQIQGLQMSRLAMYDRRDLEGVIIKAGIVEDTRRANMAPSIPGHEKSQYGSQCPWTREEPIWLPVSLDTRRANMTPSVPGHEKSQYDSQCPWTQEEPIWLRVSLDTRRTRITQTHFSGRMV